MGHEGRVANHNGQRRAADRQFGRAGDRGAAGLRASRHPAHDGVVREKALRLTGFSRFVALMNICTLRVQHGEGQDAVNCFQEVSVHRVVEWSG